MDNNIFSLIAQYANNFMQTFIYKQILPVIFAVALFALLFYLMKILTVKNMTEIETSEYDGIPTQMLDADTDADLFDDVHEVFGYN